MYLTRAGVRHKRDTYLLSAWGMTRWVTLQSERESVRSSGSFVFPKKAPRLSLSLDCRPGLVAQKSSVSVRCEGRARDRVERVQ